MNENEEARDARRSAWAGVDALIEAGYGPDSPEYREAWAALELTVGEPSLTPNERHMIRMAVNEYHERCGFVPDEPIVASILRRIPDPDPKDVTR